MGDLLSDVNPAHSHTHVRPSPVYPPPTKRFDDDKENVFFKSLKARRAIPYTGSRYWVPTPEQEKCHGDRSEIPILNYCDESEVVVENKCLENDLYDLDHVAIISRGGKKAANVTWAEERLSKVMPYFVYDKTRWRFPIEDAVKHRTIRMPEAEYRAKEADSMLYYIVANYECLPRVTVFIHPHEDNDHVPRYFMGKGNVTEDPDDTIPEILSQVCWDKVTSFYSLSTIMFDLISSHNNIAFLAEEWPKWLPDAAEHFFPLKILYYHCCQNFMVHRDVIWRRPKQFYVDLLRYSVHPDPEPYDPEKGRAPLHYLMEYSWEYIFYETLYVQRVWEFNCCLRNNCPQGAACVWPFEPDEYPSPYEIFRC